MVARWCQTRYSCRMTEFRPLGYAASVVVLFVIVAYAAAVQWSPVFRAKTMQAGWLTGMAGLRTLGVLIGMAAWIASQLMWIPHILVLLWSDRLSLATHDLRKSLKVYCDRRAFHRPQHAA